MIPISGLRCASLVVCALAFSAAPGGATDDPIPLTNAHAHNDYMHKRPLLDALDCGFCSIEADIHLVEGKLLVGHDLFQCKRERTLEALYLDPLLDRVKKNGGSVFPNGPEVTLLIDLKTDGAKTYSALSKVLINYAEMLTTFTPDRTDKKAVTVIISGNRPKEMLAAEPLRYAAVDGRREDLGTDVSVHLVPLISESWGSMFKWKGLTAMSAEERAKLRETVKKAHDKGKRIRFWGAPDGPGAWREFRDAGVDLINTDNLERLRDFLLEGKGG
ncbi:MAG TPA: phosphatidylinositol-specific phospholipase C/glycerophosphodiester phosphodiesterase family protein [Candidatus Brocadiia bacterium]|nr:phosphatidylinositol-specific phospholipase C/glycerophosphodiester phosphodiesterase family protein [Candidatus Brocadiia bacterium]